MVTRHAVILAAGEGSRCWPLTATRAKPLLPVGGETLLSRLLRQAANAGIRSATIVAPKPKGPLSKHARQAGQRLGIEVTIDVQREPQGTGHALRQAQLPDEPVLVTNGDILLPDGALRTMAAARTATLAAARVPDVSQYGALETETEPPEADADGEEESVRLTGLEEKPDRPEAGLANAGVYLLPTNMRSLLDGLEESTRGEIELTDAIEAALASHEEVRVHTLSSWMDVAWPWELLEANRRVLESMEARVSGKIEQGVQIEGPVRVEQGATVRSGSVIEGPVLIREGATVGPNAYVRGATTIGPNAKIGHGCEVKNSILFEEAKVPHVSYVGDSVLAERVNLGAGTQVANLRHDDADVTALTARGPIDTARRKLGVVLGAEAKTGVNASLNVGVILGPGERVKPGATVWESRVDG